MVNTVMVKDESKHIRPTNKEVLSLVDVFLRIPKSVGNITSLRDI